MLQDGIWGIREGEDVGFPSFRTKVVVVVVGALFLPSASVSFSKYVLENTTWSGGKSRV